MSRRLLELIGLSLGSYVGYIVYSIYQEKIFKTPYLNLQGIQEKFTYPSCNAIFPALVCFLVGTLRNKISKEGNSKIPMKQQAIIGAFYSILLFSVNSALIYLNYPTQLILGNLRLMAIYIVGRFCSRISKKASAGHGSKLYIGLFITAGIFIFNYEMIKNYEGQQKAHYQWGVLLMIIFLLAEGFLVDTQSLIKINCSPSSNDLFITTNKMTFVFSMIASLLLGQFIPILQFIVSHPSFGRDLMIFCAFGAMGQFFMYQLINKFQAYLYAVITVFRKILMVIISIVLYGHHITQLQLVGMVMVFSGLIYQVRNQIMSKKQKV